VFRVWLIRKDGTWLVTKWDAAVADKLRPTAPNRPIRVPLTC